MTRRREISRRPTTPLRRSVQGCNHGVVFDYKAASGLSADEVRKRWPRVNGICPKGCGFNGIGYASFEHYICGDW